jgi:hypothetical protein
LEHFGLANLLPLSGGNMLTLDLDRNFEEEANLFGISKYRLAKDVLKTYLTCQ